MREENQAGRQERRHLNVLGEADLYTSSDWPDCLLTAHRRCHSCTYMDLGKGKRAVR